MRMIDADILVQDTIQEYARSKQYRDAIIRMVNKAPTIEPKRGEWIDKSRILYNDWGHYYYRECSLCGYEREDDNPDNDTNFCPNCGCRMKGADDDEN